MTVASGGVVLLVRIWGDCKDGRWWKDGIER